MRLHEFIDRERVQILGLATLKLKQRSPDRAEVDVGTGLEVVLDEIGRALQRDAGLPVDSPLPGPSEAAEKVGEHRHRRGFPISEVPRAIGMLSDAIGEIGALQGLAFDAHDYHVFNQCIDSSVANAIDRYWTEAQTQRDQETSARIGALAHELRNALASAHMAFVILRQGKIGVGSRTGDVLERSLARMRGLVNQTLLAVRIESGVEHVSASIDVAKLLHDLVAEAMLERAVTVDVDVDDHVRIVSDEALLASAVSNLVQNAVKFTRAGGHVAVRVTETPEFVMIEVEDECGGLPMGFQDQLFAPFVQHSSDRRGLGLGLAITRDAVQAAGGEISVRDLPGRGCVFAIRFPRRRPDSD
jgi:signal transduction histidine kinase